VSEPDFPNEFDRERWSVVLRLAEELTSSDTLPALQIAVVRRGQVLGNLAFGRRRLATDSEAVTPSHRFVVASLTKPIVAMGVLALAERGVLTLNDRVTDWIREYNDPPKRPTTLRHLLTHTSGLPDQLPNNFELRRLQSPLSEFVRGACRIGLDFPPGRGVQYQSLGYAVLGQVIENASGVSCGEFLRTTFFEPLGMCSTSLGAAPVSSAFPDDLAEIRVPMEMTDGHSWNWNSHYWRTMGAPWGGLISTAGDLARFCQMMLNHGRWEGRQVISPAAIDVATRSQLDSFHDLPEADRRTRPWGYGWRLDWPAHPACFSDLLSPSAYGHWGATGTLFWIDPERDAAAVLLSTQPLERDRSPLSKLSNAIAALMSAKP
jgi:CubicO group peptidase (beta-lactamase class C family)